MATQAITLNLPDEIYDRLKQLAEQANRTVEDELMELVATSVPSAASLTPALEELLIGLSHLDDNALWRAARSHLPLKTIKKLASLNLKSQREGLTEAEEQTRGLMLRQYDKYMLIRAEAAYLLKQRGYDVSELGPRN